MLSSCIWNGFFVVVLENDPISAPNWFVMCLERRVITTVSQSFPSPIFTPCDLCKVISFKNMSGVVIVEQHYFSRWTLDIVMGYRVNDLSENKYWYSLINHFGKSRTIWYGKAPLTNVLVGNLQNKLTQPNEAFTRQCSTT